jgi:hypothetical protein
MTVFQKVISYLGYVTMMFEIIFSVGSWFANSLLGLYFVSKKNQFGICLHHLWFGVGKDGFCIPHRYSKWLLT